MLQILFLKKKSHMQRGQGASTLIASSLLLLILLITSWVHQGDIKWLSFGWTRRAGIPNAAQEIADAYKKNTDTSPASINNLYAAVTNSAYCKPFNYGGHLSWKPDQVSGLCKCLGNAHAEYVQAVCNTDASTGARNCVTKSAMGNPHVSNPFFFLDFAPSF